jgi:hypothetical protein
MYEIIDCLQGNDAKMRVSLGVGAGNISKTVRPVQTNCVTKNPKQAERGFASTATIRRMHSVECILELSTAGLIA